MAKRKRKRVTVLCKACARALSKPPKPFAPGIVCRSWSGCPAQLACLVYQEHHDD